MTFTNDPHFIALNENSNLLTNLQKVMKTDMGYSTNLDKAFTYILIHATMNGVSAEELPKALVVISDMEIDPYFRGSKGFDFLETQKRKFEANGYKLPKLILWNVESRQDTYLTQSEDVILVSGQSASTFKNLISSINVGAYSMMLNTLNDKMYDCITI